MIRRLHSTLLLLVILPSALPPPRAGREDAVDDADVLTPEKGHALFGTFRAATNQQVTFETDAGPTVTLKWSEVKELDVKHKATVIGKKPLGSTGSPKSLNLEAATIKAEQGSLLINGDGNTITVAQSDIVSISPKAAEGTAKRSAVWRGSVTGKGSLTEGTQSQQTLGAQVYIRRTQNAEAADWQHQVTTLILEANNSLLSQVGTPSIRIDSYDGTFNHQVYLWKSFYADVMAAGYHNSSLNLYLEQAYGGGIGKNVYKDDRNTLSASADFLHIGEHFTVSVPSVEFTGVLLREDYAYTITYVRDNPLTFAESLSYTPAFDLKNAWQLRGIVTLSIPMTKTFSTTVSYFDDYMENAPKVRKNFSTTSLGITYTLPSHK